MALTFSSKGCNDAASELTNAANKLDSLLNSDLNGIISKVKNAYESETADELYDAFEKMKAKFPDFINSVSNCSKYLKDTVAPAYEELERKAAGKIN